MGIPFKAVVMAALITSMLSKWHPFEWDIDTLAVALPCYTSPETFGPQRHVAGHIVLMQQPMPVQKLMTSFVKFCAELYHLMLLKNIQHRISCIMM